MSPLPPPVPGTAPRRRLPSVRPSARWLRAALATLLLVGAADAQLCDDLGPLTSPAADTELGPSGGDQVFPDVAAGASSSLAAWPDNRSEFSSLLVGEGARDVYARRLAPDGSPLDALPFRVAGGQGRKEDVRVTWNGTHWLVTWSQDLPTQFFEAAAVLGARVTPAGDVLDDPPVEIRRYEFSSVVGYAVASDGVGWAVVTQGTSAGETAVEGHLVAADGTVSDVPGSLLSGSTLWFDMRMDFAAGRYLLSGTSSSTVGRFLSPSLATLSGTFTLAPGGAATFDTDGTDWLVAWSAGGPGAQVLVRTVSSTGAAGPTRQVTPLSPVEYAYDPVVAWTGAGYTVAFTHDLAAPTEIRVARVAQDGTVLDFGGLPAVTGTDARDARITSLGGGDAQLVWARGAGIEPFVADVASTRLAASTTPDPTVELGNGRPRQGDPDLAAGGLGYLSVFTSEHDGITRVLAHRLDGTGAPMDPEPAVVTAGLHLASPRVAWNGQHFLVVWEDPHDLSFPSFEGDNEVLGRRMAADGTFLDPAPFSIALADMPDVDAVGGTFLVAASLPVTTEIRRIVTVRVDATGTVLDATPVEIGSNFARWPSVASFDDRWLVAWQRNPTHDNPATSVRYAVVLADGTSLGEVPVTSGPRPAAAASDTTGLVTFLSSGEARALRVAKDGAALGPTFPLTDQPGLQEETSAAWTGDEFVVAWEDERAQLSLVDDRRDVYATRVLEDGTVLTFDGCPVAATPEPEQMPVVAGRDGSALVAVARFEPDAPAVNVRVAYAADTVWADLGGASKSVPPPTLAVAGPLTPGSTLTVDLTGATPLAPALAFLAFESQPLSFLGGTLHAFPFTRVIGASTDATGALHAAGTFPGGAQGLGIWIQVAVVDASVPTWGATLSNGVKGTVQ